MGLDTTHGCWRGSYSAFARWREKLADVAGYDYVEATGKYGTFHSLCVDWAGAPDPELLGEWGDVVPHRLDGTPDPLLYLLMHSDCEGVLKAEHCGPLADRLEELIELLPDEDDRGHIGNWRDKTQTFIDGLRLASEAGEDVEFR